jgi:hypothetical protein
MTEGANNQDWKCLNVAVREKASGRVLEYKVNTRFLAQRGVGGIGKLGQSPTTLSLSHSISTTHPYFWAPFILVGDAK